MNKKIISFIGICVVLALIFISVKYFRGGIGFNVMNNSTLKVQEREEDRRYQEGEPDEISKEFARQLEKEMVEVYQSETGESREYTKNRLREDPLDISPEKVVTVGKKIETGDLSYQVDRWEITKNNQGYTMPGDVKDSLFEFHGVEIDENETIVNDSSYVIVDVTVENLLENEITEYVWGRLRLGQLGYSEEVSKEPEWLGEHPQRKYGKSYNLETIPGNGKKSIALIFLLKDEWIERGQFFIEINPSGVVPITSSCRWIVLE